VREAYERAMSDNKGGADDSNPGVGDRAVAQPAVAPLDAQAFAYGAIGILAVFAALYVARAVILPIALALLLSFLLRPVVRFLERLHVPTLIGAALVLVTLVVAVAAGVSLLYEPASRWAARAPQILAELDDRLQDVREVVRAVRRATEGVEKIASPEDPEAVTVEVREATLPGAILQVTWQFLGGLVVMLFLLYFLLASGDLFLRKLVRVLPRLEDKKQAVEIARQIEHDVSRYLFTIALINAGLGTTVGFAMYLIGMPNAVLWGVMAGVLNFMPYLGPMITLTVLSAVSLLTFDALGEALLAPALFLVLTSLEGQLLTPLILGRRLMLNPVVIFIGLIFWGWLWGIPGVLLAVPLLMIFKILCDHIEPLAPVGEFLAR
jgi:predicted PurR-regulated permease PerM